MGLPFHFLCHLYRVERFVGAGVTVHWCLSASTGVGTGGSWVESGVGDVFPLVGSGVDAVVTVVGSGVDTGGSLVKAGVGWLGVSQGSAFDGFWEGRVSGWGENAHWGSSAARSWRVVATCGFQEDAT